MIAHIEELSETQIVVTLPREWWNVGKVVAEQHAHNIAEAATLGRTWSTFGIRYDAANELVEVKLGQIQQGAEHAQGHRRESPR